MGGHGLRVNIDVDAALDDVEVLKACAETYVSHMRELRQIPDEVLTAWSGAHSSKTIEAFKVLFDRMDGQEERIKNIANGITQSVAAIMNAELANREVARQTGAKARERAEKDWYLRGSTYGSDDYRRDKIHEAEEVELNMQGWGSGQDEEAADAYQGYTMGGITYDGNGHPLYDSNGNIIKPNGNLVDPKTNAVVGNMYGVADADGTVRNGYGDVVRLPNGDTVDGMGNVTDYWTRTPKGNLYGTFDEYGNVRDDSGRIVVYHDGNRVDEGGNIINRRTGEVVGNVTMEELDRKMRRQASGSE